MTFEPSKQDNKASASSIVSLYDCGSGIFSIRIAALESSNTLSYDLIMQLLQALDTVQQSVSVKVLILNGANHSFLSGGREHYNSAVEQKLYQAITSFPFPIIAAMQGDAIGAGFLVGALCDFMICSQTATYYYTNPQEGIYPSVSEDLLLKERFGEGRATDFLYLSTASTGKQLQEKGWTCPIIPQDQIVAYAFTLASNLAKKSQDTLRLLKQHLSRHIIDLANALATVSPLSVESLSNNTVKADSKIISYSKQIKLETHSKGVLIIRLCIAKKGIGIKMLVADLTAIFAQLKKALPYKSIVLVSDYPDFLPETSSVDEVLDFQRLVLESPLPIISVLNSKAKGMAWFISQFCDACIYNENGSYSAANIGQNPELAKLAAMIFSHRLGNYAGKEVLFTGNTYTGLELQQRVGSLIVAKQNQGLPTALELAKSWVVLPLETLMSWKKQMTLSIREKIRALPVWIELKDEENKPLENKPVSIALNSKAVTATIYPEGILVVKMEDREAKNMFSDAIVQGMNEVFEHIEHAPEYKVVVLTGYDHYFASGGTKETLVAIQEGKTKFTDSNISHIAMTCKVPVIAAMQGHGVGGGWTLGMFADFVLFSEESKYFSPYMNYGFTPGAGATFIFPEKIGYDLGRETLLTALEYSGSELKGKGLLMPVLPREEVYQAAMDLAKQIASRSRSSLIAFKHQLSHHLHKPLEETYKLELSMHDKTFVGQSDTLKQIHDNFIQEGGSRHSQTNNDENSALSAAVVSSSDRYLLPSVEASIKKLLADELHMPEHELDENTQFIDLGLDSITGVTFMRKVNEKYKTSIEAIKVYSYPTVTKLSCFVKEEAEKRDISFHSSEFISSVKPVTVSDESHEGHQYFQTNINERPQSSVFAALSSDTDNLQEVMARVKNLLAEELHLQEHEIDENTQFIDLGLDSITGVTFMRKINEHYKTSIEAIKVYSFPSLSKLSHFVKDEAERKGTLSIKSEFIKPLITGDVEAMPKSHNTPQLPGKNLVSWRNKQSARITPVTSSFNKSQSIAVIGMAGKFPQANNLEDFWQNIAEGKNCITEIPKKRWDINTYYQEGNAISGKTNCKWAGSLDEYDLFDPLFFNISPTEAESMDPQQRMFLQACWHAIENSGYNAKSLSGSKCSVFVGCGQGDYRLLSRDLQISALGFTGGDTSILAARISYFLNLQGPSLSIETACSSSLVAIANACDSLVAGNSDLALTGGVYVMTGPEVHIKSSQTGMLSPDGRCYTFDQRANGFVPGEGVGVVMLKRLADAEKDQDMILGVIEGWGVNQDGKTNGITAPNPESQTRLEQDVYDKYQIDPESIQMIEAHGTGTKLGDPIEVDALQQSFKKYTQKKEYCALGSVKSNIGHCLTAAGVASFIKVLLALKHKQLPPSINFDQLNEHIGLKDSPFYVNNQLKEWQVKDSQRRQAAISAFGFSGTNAHVVIGEYLSPNKAKPSVFVIDQNGKIIIPLSARNQEQLKQKSLDLLDFLRKNQSIDLIDLAYTLQVGREEMEDRLGFLVSSIDQLVEKLQAYIDGKENIGDVYLGQVKRNKADLKLIIQDNDMKDTIIDKWITQKNLSKLLDLWIKGLDLDWKKLYGEVKPQRIALPVYPFAKERYWIEAEEVIAVSKKGAMNSVLHPLLHTNTSNLREQSYSSTFVGEELFLKDHQVNGQKILPAVAYLEMARAAVENALPANPDSRILELHNTVWLQPIVVAEKKEVTIALFANDVTGSLIESIDYEVFSRDAEQEILHCQGKAVLSKSPAPVKIDIARLKRQMQNGKLEHNRIYEIFTKMGLSYGPAHQALVSISLGENQLLAQLRLPTIAETGQIDYLLHPSMMDCALQSSIGLIADLKHGPNKPILPFALELLRVVSACTTEMVAWVRYSLGSNSDDKIMKLDIDLCDLEGNVCVQMKGFVSRFLEGEIKLDQKKSTTSPINNNTLEDNNPFDDVYYQKLIDGVLNNEVSVDEAVDLG